MRRNVGNERKNLILEGLERRRWLSCLLALPMIELSSFCQWLIPAEVCGREAELKEIRDHQIFPNTYLSVRGPLSPWRKAPRLKKEFCHQKGCLDVPGRFAQRA